MAFQAPKVPDAPSHTAPIDASARTLIRGLARSGKLNPKLRLLLLDALLNEDRSDRPAEPDATVSAEVRAATEWIGASPAERGAALAELLPLADALPQGRRRDTAPSLPGKVVAVDRALNDAAIEHAVGGALALAYYGVPRMTIDIDVNVFTSVERAGLVAPGLGVLGVEVDLDERELAQEHQVRLAWDENPVHLFFSYDELHAAMPAAARQVPFAGTTIPIVSPEHLMVRKALLDRPKDWPDIEAILVATEPLDVEETERWLTRLAGPDDPRVTKMRGLAGRLLT